MIIINEMLIPALDVVGDKFEKRDNFPSTVDFGGGCCQKNVLMK